METVLVSQRLMESEFALSSDQEDQVAALLAHLRRADQLFERARHEPLALHLYPELWIRDAEATLVEWKTRLKPMSATR